MLQRSAKQFSALTLLQLTETQGLYNSFLKHIVQLPALQETSRQRLVRPRTRLFPLLIQNAAQSWGWIRGKPGGSALTPLSHRLLQHYHLHHFHCSHDASGKFPWGRRLFTESRLEVLEESEYRGAQPAPYLFPTMEEWLGRALDREETRSLPSHLPTITTFYCSPASHQNTPRHEHQ